MKNTPLLVSALLAFTQLACSGTPKIQDSPARTAGAIGKESILTRDQAMYRSKQLKKITYNLWFHLDEQSEDFQGRVTVLFDLSHDADRFLDTLRMDFTDGKIQTLRVNQQAWSAEKIHDRYDGSRIEFKISELIKGQNRVEIAYTHPYSKTGNGLYRFKDPSDGQLYFYTHLEPYYANLVFPCFDQPDLKASYETTVEVPTDWEVITNVPQRDITKVGGKNSWQFPPTPVFSTYLFALHAGAWKEWKSNAEGIPMRLFARQSEAKHVDPQNWFNVTRKGLAFFSDFYGVPYPYGKYDQVIVPNLNAGAMENIAAVTFTERYNFRSKPTSDQLLKRSQTILHEMAHMWFGNLVTMRWWNGLWLNESFASYMAHLASAELKLYPGVAETFNRGMKEWAYFEDSLVTNHPIEVSVIDTSQAFAIFDGITYGKGASALQQLHQFVGDDDFREGLHRYFIRFANLNTVLADLIQSIGSASSKDLTGWQSAWLQTKGTNTVEARLQCSGGKIQSLTIVQTAPGEGNVLRPHRLQSAFYSVSREGTPVRMKGEIPLTLTSAETAVKEAVGKPCPDLVFLNDGDLGFVRQNFTPADIQVFKKGLSRMEPLLNRQMVWSTLRNGVRNGTVNARDFAEIAKAHLSREKTPELVSSIASFMFNPRSSAFSLHGIFPEGDRKSLLSEWHQIARRQLSASPAGSDLQVAWWTMAVLTVHDSESANWALSVATEKTKIPKLSLGTDRIYALVQAAARVGPVPDELLAKLLEKDSSEESLVQNLKTRALLAGSEATLETFKLFTREKKVPAEWDNPSRLRKIMPGFLHSLNEARVRAWTPIYLQNLVRISRETDETYAEDFATSLYPALCEEAQRKTLADSIAKMDLPFAVKKSLRQVEQLDQECIRARAALKQSE